MQTPERVHALDAARGFALILGVVLHASMSFFFVLPTQDVSQGTAPAVVFHVIHAFRMALFFLLAGYFARLTLQRRSARGFVLDRAKRIGIPLVAGWLLLAPPVIVIVAIGLTRGAADSAALPAEPPAAQGFPLMHLWFLYYLCLFYVAALALRSRQPDASARRGVLDRLLGRAIASRVLPLALAAPLAGVLLFDAHWAPWFGIPTPDFGFAPKLPATLAFGSAFALGWWLQRQPALLTAIGAQWAFHLLLAGALSATCLLLAGPAPDLAAATQLAAGESLRPVYALCYALSTWCWTLGLLGAALRFCAGESRVRRYLADASYWVYLAHLPLVFGLQVLLARLPLHWSVKFPLIVVGAMGLLLGSYQLLVRRTWLGALLNGRRHPPPGVEPSGTPSVPQRSTEQVVPVAELRAATKRYGQALALDRVDVGVRPGELLALLGPNGAGKTTAIGLWLGTLAPDEGQVRVLGAAPDELAGRRGVGAMLQEVALTAELRVREHLALFSSYYPRPLPLQDAASLAGIEALLDRRYGQLSGGQKRQVQFALALCGRPRLLFLDEPTVGLDLDARQAMWRAIRHLLEAGCAIVLTTHYLEEAEALADRVVVLARGQVVAEGSVEAVRARVARARIRCNTPLAADEVRGWHGVLDARRDGEELQVTATDAESVVLRLLSAGAPVSRLEVSQASLAEAFTTITREAA